MRKQAMTLGLTLTLVLAAGVVAAAGSKSSVATGKLTSIDTTAMTLTIETHSGPQTFKVDDSSSIVAQDTHKKLQFTDLKTGERLRLHYLRGTQSRVSRIEVLPEHHAANHPAERRDQHRR